MKIEGVIQIKSVEYKRMEANSETFSICVLLNVDSIPVFLSLIGPWAQCQALRHLQKHVAPLQSLTL